MAVDVLANLAYATVTSGGTTVVAPGTVETWTVTGQNNIPAAVTGVTQFRVVDQNTNNVEIMLCTNVSGSTWTVTRGVESTTPVAHAASWTAVITVTSAAISNLISAAVALSGITLTSQSAGSWQSVNGATHVYTGPAGATMTLPTPSAVGSVIRVINTTVNAVTIAVASGSTVTAPTTILALQTMVFYAIGATSWFAGEMGTA